MQTVLLSDTILIEAIEKCINHGFYIKPTTTDSGKQDLLWTLKDFDD